MTYEEARNMIDEMRAEIRAKHMCRSMDGECTSEEVAEYRCRFAALSMAIEALEKQIPKKPIYSDFNDNGFDEIIPYRAECPACGESVEFGKWNDEESHHCECGQALNWE